MHKSVLYRLINNFVLLISKRFNKFNHSPGFTIIEVIIVLVIAAVIMLMVFLVVPQLQRSQRNTRRQSNARQILAAAEQSAANKGGTYPTADSTGKALIDAVTEVPKAPSGNAYSWIYPTAAVTSPDNNTIYYTWNTFTCTNGAPTVTTNSGKTVVIVANEGPATSTAWCVGN